MVRYLLLLSVLAPLPLRNGRVWRAMRAAPNTRRMKQIDRANVQRLKVAWTYHTGEISDGKTVSVRSAI